MEDILRLVGEFGRFQYKITFIIGLISALTSACIYATVFIVAEPKLVCTKYDQLNASSNVDMTMEETCRIFKQLKKVSNESFAKNYTCYFDTQYYDKTIITEYSLVCERQYLAGLTQTGHILGATFGFFGGIIGDKYGRRKSTLLFSFLLTVCLILTQSTLNITSLSVDARYTIFFISQFLIGLLVNCVYVGSYTCLMEFTTDEHKTKISNLNAFMYVLGEFVVGIVYYFSRDWNLLCWLIAVYSFLILILTYLFMYESPVWLMDIKCQTEAFKVFEQIAKSNGRQENWEKMELKNYEVNYGKTDLVAVTSNTLFLKSVFTPKKNFLKTGLLFLIWISLILLYYGISLGVTSLDSVDPYLMYFLSALAELLGYVSCYINEWISKKKALSGFFIVTSFVYALIAYLSLSGEFTGRTYILLIFSLLGKCAISGAYNLIYIYTTELYSISTRNTVLLFLVCFGGTSSMVAPQINLLKNLVWSPLPHIIYSCFSVFTCVCIWLLPDV